MAYRRSPLVQGRIDAQRAAIVAAAAQLLAEQGYAGLRMNAVAERAGVAAGSVYRHFAGKAELTAELFRTLAGREVEAVRAATRSGSAAERIVALIETFAHRALKSPRRAYLLLAEPVDPGVDELRLKFRRAFRDVLAEILTRGVRVGELPPQRADLAAAALVGAVGEALVGPLATGVEEPETVSGLIAFALRAVGGRTDAHA